MKIVIDLDGVICYLKKDSEKYSDVYPLKDAIKKIKELKEKGHYIIIYTSRHMLTTNSNLGRINKLVGKETLEWLEKYGIPYDEIYFGKPYGDVYIDDSAITFSGWQDINAEDFDETFINIVIPMAGIGKRFIDAGYVIPKPLITLKNKPMFEIATSSFNDIMKNYSNKFRLIYVILEEHAEKYSLDKKIIERYPFAKIIKVNTPTRGQAETVLLAKNYINNYNKLLIFNCDSYFESKELLSIIENSRVDGAIACFEDYSEDERYSFVKVDNANYVIEVAEKRRISNYASNGLYYFRYGRDFVKLAERMVLNNETVRGEFYVIPVYNKMIELGKRIKMFKVEKNYIFGTPEELKRVEEEWDLKI